MTREEELRRAEDAKRMLGDPLFIEAWDALRARLIAVMETAKTDEATIKAKVCLGLLSDLKQHWARVMKDGVIAADSIKFEDEQKKRGGLFRRSA